MTEPTSEQKIEDLQRILEGVTASQVFEIDVTGGSSRGRSNDSEPSLVDSIFSQVSRENISHITCPTIAVRTLNKSESILVMAVKADTGDPWKRTLPLQLQANISSMAVSDLLEIVKKDPRIFFEAFRRIAGSPVGLGPEPKVYNENQLMIYPPVMERESLGDYVFRHHEKTGQYRPKVLEFDKVEFNPVEILTRENNR